VAVVEGPRENACLKGLCVARKLGKSVCCDRRTIQRVHKQTKTQGMQPAEVGEGQTPTQKLQPNGRLLHGGCRECIARHDAVSTLSLSVLFMIRFSHSF